MKKNRAISKSQIKTLFLFAFFFYPFVFLSQVNFNPQIQSSFNSDCIDQLVDENGSNSIPPDLTCETVCEGSTVTYTVGPSTPGHIYSWVVSGTYLSVSGVNTNTLTVNWGTLSQATITVTETDMSGISQSDEICVEVVLTPTAGFQYVDGGQNTVNSDDMGSVQVVTVCLGSTLCFNDVSVDGSSWQWDFGNSTYSNQQTPCVTYNVPGTYLVSQTVMNECHCFETEYLYIDVIQEVGPEITCATPICGQGTFTYSATVDPSCANANFQWTVSSNGVITTNGVNAQSISGSGLTSISVSWGSGPNGTIGLITNCGSMCQQYTTVEVPIIPNTLNMVGESLVCIDDIEEYSVPCFPGTNYYWFVDNVQQTGIANSHVFSYEFDTYGTHTIYVDYESPFLDCSGSSAVYSVEVLDTFAIASDSIICEGTSITVTGPGGHQYGWTLLDQFGNVPANSTACPNSNSCTTSINLPAGIYTITAHDVTGAYCNKHASHTFTVIEQPPTPAMPVGNSTVCLGVLETYTALATNNDYYLQWEVTNGTTITISNGNSVDVTWVSGNKHILLYQVSKISECLSVPAIVNIQENTMPSNTISGTQSVCANTINTYSASAGMDSYNWVVNPSTAGSIISGQGTDAIDILWNNAAIPATIVLTPTFCGSVQSPISYPIIVNTVSLNISGPVGPFCQNQLMTWTALTTSGWTNVQWEIFDANNLTTSVAFGSGTSASHSFASDGTFIVQFTGTKCGIQHTATQTVFVLPAPIGNLTSTSGIECIDQNTATLYVSVQNVPGATGPYTYTWIGPNGSTTGTMTNINIGAGANFAGTYMVEIEDANGCTSVTNPISAAVCIGGGGGGGCQPPANLGFLDFMFNVNCNTVTVNPDFSNVGCSPTSFQWNFANQGGSQSPGPASYTFSASGIYPVTYSVWCPGPCSHLEVTHDIEIPIFADFEVVVNCNGPNGQLAIDLLNTSNVLNGPFDNTNFTFDWTVCGVPVGSSLDKDIFSYTGMANGSTCVIELTVSDGTNTCTTSQTFTMPTSATAAFSVVVPACENTPYQFSDGSTGNNITSWDWTFGDGSGNLVQNPLKTYAASATYPVTLSVEDEYGCVNSTTQNLVVNQNVLTGSITGVPANMPVCSSTSVTLGFSGTGTYTYLWSNGATSSTISLTQSGSFSLEVYETSTGCSKSFGPVTVEIIDVPQPLIAGEAIYCVGEDILLSSNNGPAYQYNWYEASNASTSLSTTTELEIFGGYPVGVYEFVVEITDSASGCMNASNTYVVEVFGNPTAPILTTPMCLNGNGPTQLNVMNSFNYTSFAWTSGQTSPSIVVYDAGDYYVVGTDVNGCSSESFTTVFELPDFCGYIDGCLEGCLDSLTGQFNFPGITGNYNYWEWQVFDGVNWSPYTSGTGVVQDLVLSGLGTYEIRLFVVTTQGCSGTSDVTSLNVVDCTPICNNINEDPGVFDCNETNNQYDYILYFDLNSVNIGGPCPQGLDYIITPPGNSGTIDPPGSNVPPYGPSFAVPLTLAPAPANNNMVFVWHTGVTVGSPPPPFPTNLFFNITVTNPCDGTVCTQTFNPDVSGGCNFNSPINSAVKSSQSNMESNVVIYPNPAEDHVMISSEMENFSVVIQDMKGKIIHQSTNNSGTSRIELHETANGVYLVSVHDKTGRQLKTSKLTIVK